MRRQFSGRIFRCQRSDPGSIPGLRILIFPTIIAKCDDRVGLRILIFPTIIAKYDDRVGLRISSQTIINFIDKFEL